MLNRHLTKFASVPMLAVTVATFGCTSLGKPKGVAKPHGQTIAKGHRIEKTTAAIFQQTKRKSSDLIAKVRRALPGKPRSQMVEQVINKGDPTRLDNIPSNINPNLYIAAARLAERNGRYDQAFEQYNMALQRDGRNRNALIGLARLQHQTGNLEAAIRVYRDALNTFRNDPAILNDLGLCYARNGQLNEAISVLQAATHAAPDRALYLNNLSSCLVEMDRAAEAFAQFARVQGTAKANYNVGYLLARAGRKSEAEKYLSQALAIDPNMHKARALLGENAPQVSALPNAAQRGISQQIN